MAFSFCISLPLVLFLRFFGLGMTGGLAPPDEAGLAGGKVKTSSLIPLGSLLLEPSTLSDSEKSLLLSIRLRVDRLLLWPEEGGLAEEIFLPPPLEVPSE